MSQGTTTRNPLYHTYLKDCLVQMSTVSLSMMMGGSFCFFLFAVALPLQGKIGRISPYVCYNLGYFRGNDISESEVFFHRSHTLKHKKED